MGKKKKKWCHSIYETKEKATGLQLNIDYTDRIVRGTGCLLKENHNLLNFLVSEFIFWTVPSTFVFEDETLR